MSLPFSSPPHTYSFCHPIILHGFGNLQIIHIIISLCALRFNLSLLSLSALQFLLVRIVAMRLALCVYYCRWVIRVIHLFLVVGFSF